MTKVPHDRYVVKSCRPMNASALSDWLNENKPPPEWRLSQVISNRSPWFVIWERMYPK